MDSSLRADIESRLSRALDGEQLVVNVHAIMDTLEKAGLVYKAKLPPQQVGAHPQNRDGLGVVSDAVHDLLDSIAEVGYMPQKVDAVAVEIPDGSEGDEIRRFNHQLVGMSSGRLGVMQADKLRAATLCGSHTNNGVEHNNERITVDGKLSLQKIQERDPGLHDAIVNGLPWRMITKAVAQNFPELLPLIQQCGNASLVKGEGELQILIRLHNVFIQEKKDGLMPDYQRIKKRALASRPACAKSAPHLYQFMLKFAGGQDGSFLAETEQFCRAHGSSTKSLGPALWEILAADVKGRTDQHVWVRHAFKLAWVKDIGTPSDIKRCLHSKEFAKRLEVANQLMSETKGIVDKLGMPWAVDGKVAAALGFTHIAMAAFLLNAKIPGESYHDSLEGIAHDFVPWNVLWSNLHAVTKPTCRVLRFALDLLNSVVHRELCIAAQVYHSRASPRRNWHPRGQILRRNVTPIHRAHLLEVTA